MEIRSSELPPGPVVLLGGPPVPDEAIVETIHLAGGRSMRVGVLPVAAEASPTDTVAEATRLFTRFGVKRVEVIDLNCRENAGDPECADRLAEYDAVVLCGESASRGLGVLQGTRAAVTLRRMAWDSKLLLGMGAGAAILGSRVFGAAESDGMVQGLGVLPGLILETQASQAERFSRLLRAMCGRDEASCMLGTVVDAGAALIVRGNEAKVLGDGTVTFVDARDTGSAGDTGLKVHPLTGGYRMHLRSRRPIPPVSDEGAVAR